METLIVMHFSFKLNRDFGGYHLTNRSEVTIDELDAPIKFPIVEPEQLRFPGALFTFSNVSFSYSRQTPNVLENVNLVMHPGDRVGLVGKNGQGKSTLIKLLMGHIKPSKGTVETHTRLKIGYARRNLFCHFVLSSRSGRYYSQHSVEELSGQQVGEASALNHFMASLKPDINVDEPTARSFLGSLGLHGATATMPVRYLSGGQKVSWYKYRH